MGLLFIVLEVAKKDNPESSIHLLHRPRFGVSSMHGLAAGGVVDDCGVRSRIAALEQVASPQI
ncbi:MAG TPA: hypothetical protein VNZ22_08525 [Bacillota bacterium]|nr:hypothetical protein [Bacillota bacterium]